MGFRHKKFFVFGVGAGLGLLGLYFLVLSLVNSFSHAISQFLQLWYWILILAAGFGLQVGLYSFIREAFYQKQIKSPAAAVAASGSISAGSMVVCCLHHLADVLPLIGLAGAALFLVRYQTFFLFLGILSNIVGIILLLEIIQKHRLAAGNPILKKILVYDLEEVKKFALIVSLILLPVAFFITGILGKFSILPENNIAFPAEENDLSKKIILPSRTNSQDGITFEAAPLDFNSDKPVKFEIKIDAHSGSLDFDLTKIAALEDGNGDKYPALEWQGLTTGGHHRSGFLFFPKLNFPTDKIKLVIQIVPPIIFEWNLN